MALSEQQQQEAEAVVIPEHERALREAHAAGDTKAIAAESDKYTEARYALYEDTQKTADKGKSADKASK